MSINNTENHIFIKKLLAEENVKDFATFNYYDFDDFEAKSDYVSVKSVLYLNYFYFYFLVMKF